MLIQALEILTNVAMRSNQQHSIRKEVMIPVIDLLVARHASGGVFVHDVDGFKRELIKVETNNPSETVLLNIARSIQVTNAFVCNRKSLCIRLDPVAIFLPKTSVPYGTYFMIGDHFSGFHVRFRNVARGGLRIVTSEKATIPSVMDECYALAYAQHLKNKDIPESGAKGILLVSNKNSVDKSVMNAIDGLLDCILPHKDVLHAKDRDDIYLGPDEQITPEHIDNIVSLATERGHPAPRTFMTSKMKLGFNHKKLGVTSESVETFMHLTMRKMCFPRHKIFTVKITGGPDGDVAGNMLRILYREYGDWCKVVGIADGTAVCEDPEGISWHSIMKLVHANKPLCEFDTYRVGTKLLKIDACPENEVLRDTMQERVQADVFIPAGGRPFTVNDKNYMNVAKTTKLIVEGANLFITPSARDKISSKSNIPIIKDSSANKGGVCTSSMEVLVSMILTEDEIVKHKEALEESVLKYVKYLARIESEALLRNYPTRKDLHRVSEEMSTTIIQRKGEIYDSLCKSPIDYTYFYMDQVVKKHLPSVIVELGWNRVRTHIPIHYARMMVAATIASHEVYNKYFI